DYNYLDDQWHHVIGVYNGVETKLYIDNELKDSDSTLGLINIIDELKIGWDDCPTCSPSRYWTGELDDILVYNRTLTTQEIDSLYHLNGWGTGLVAYYPFNGNADDESGNGNNGTVNGATLTTDRFGNVNSAYSFDGIDDYIVINSSDILESSDSITVNAFFKPGISNSTVGGRIINKDDQYAGDPDRSYYLRVDNLGDSNYKFIWNVYNVQLTTFHADYEANLDTSQWYHIAGSYDGTHQKLYFNGQLVADSTVNLARQKGNAPIYFGRPNYGAYIAEYIDDVGIYNRALSDAEIDSLYHLGGWGTQLVSDTLFFDDFSGDLSQWTEYNGGGSYNIQIVGSDGNPAPSLLADDYASWGCSAISNEVFSYSNGLSVSADHKNAAPTSQRYTFMALTTVPVGDYTNIVRVSLNYGNTALHCALRYDSAGVEYDESVLQPVPTVEGWQNCRFEIRSDHYVEFFYNDSLVYTSQHQITQQYDGQVKVRIGHRKSYYDNVLVMSVQETQNMYTVSLGNTEVSHPDTSSVPVNIVGAQGVNINSFELTLNKGSGEILFMGVDTNSTLIGDAGWIYALNETDTTILFAAAGSNEITTDGTLLNLRYTPMGDPCITVPIEIRSCLVNTGSDSLTLENGSVTILPAPNYGDVDENGMIQAYDAAVLLEHIVGEDTLVCQGLANAEVSLNDTLTALDASLILQYRVDSIDTLPYSGDLLLASGDIHLLDEVYTVADTQVAVPIIGNMCEDIYSMEGTVLFDSTQMSFSEMVLYEL
ncbi:MAG: LamG-like jellyroll fold domain-containing protein, partial [Fidelibacterota bacterium]